MTIETTIHQRIKALVDKFAEGKNTVFAQKLGVSEANIRSYIRGIMPKADILSKIVTTYGVDATWLLTGKEEEPNSSPPVQPDAKDYLGETMVDRFLQTIQKQAEEIGRLKEKVAQLEGAAKASPRLHTTTQQAQTPTTGRSYASTQEHV